MKKATLIPTLAIALGAIIVLFIGMSFRWYNAKNGRQEYKYETTEAPFTKALHPKVGYSYFFSDMYQVTYTRGKWPFIDTKVEHKDRKFMSRNDNPE